MNIVKNEDNHLALTVGSDDSGTGGWASTAWVKDLFNNEPSVVALGELQSESAGFHYDFVVSVKLPDGTLRRHLLTWINFNYNTITQLVHSLLLACAGKGYITSRWLAEWALRRALRLAVDRHTLGLAAPKPDAELEHPKELTAETVAADREERIAVGHERRTAKGDEEMKKGNCCTECGVSFVTNLRFGQGDEQLCGDCEAKHDEENGQRQVQLEFVFQRRRLLVPKRNTRFDARPGIDDVGLGGSGPNWED